MKRVLQLILATFFLQTATAQISITSADMPVSGDTLRYSFASPVGSTINLGDSGANVTWNYALTPLRQAVDTYKTASSVNFLYLVTVGPTAIGYKVADSFPGLGGLLPVSIQQLYTFFEPKTGPSRFQAKAFAANISGLPTAINYTTPDVWYFFPLNYASAHNDSSQFKLNITLPSVGGIKQAGYRKSRVDGWGTITTPYYTTPVNCIRVRSEIHEVDSLSFGTFPAIGFPRNSVEYKWLVNGDHYPALWVTTNLGFGGTGETISNIRYRDSYRDTNNVNLVNNIEHTIIEVKANPNPSANGRYVLDIPADWQNYTIEIYDLQSKLVAQITNEAALDLGALPKGTYIGRVLSGTNTGYLKLER